MSRAKTPESLRKKIEEGIMFLIVTGKKSITFDATKKEKKWFKDLESV